MLFESVYVQLYPFNFVQRHISLKFNSRDKFIVFQALVSNKIPTMYDHLYYTRRSANINTLSPLSS